MSKDHPTKTVRVLVTPPVTLKPAHYGTVRTARESLEHYCAQPQNSDYAEDFRQCFVGQMGDAITIAEILAAASDSDLKHAEGVVARPSRDPLDDWEMARAVLDAKP